MRPRATCRPTSARTSGSTAASVCGIRSCKSRYRWFSARIVTVTVARSSSRVTEANPVIDLIMKVQSGASRILLASTSWSGDPAEAGSHSGLASFEQLHLVQRRIRSRRTADEIVMSADLRDPPLLEHDDRVGPPDRRQPVRDDERG